MTIESFYWLRYKKRILGSALLMYIPATLRLAFFGLRNYLKIRSSLTRVNDGRLLITLSSFHHEKSRRDLIAEMKFCTSLKIYSRVFAGDTFSVSEQIFFRTDEIILSANKIFVVSEQNEFSEEKNSVPNCFFRF